MLNADHTCRCLSSGLSGREPDDLMANLLSFLGFPVNLTVWGSEGLAWKAVLCIISCSGFPAVRSL